MSVRGREEDCGLEDQEGWQSQSDLPHEANWTERALSGKQCNKRQGRGKRTRVVVIGLRLAF